MANSDKNIRITTSKNKTTYPNIVFTGSAAGSSVITLEVLDDNTLSFTSNEGQVFSIDSNLSTGTIWAVSDISGVPLLSASAGGTVGLGVYGGLVAIGQTNPIYKLDLKGSFGLASSNDSLYNFIFSNSAASGSNSLQIRSANSLLLYNSGNTFYTGFKSNAATNITYTLPTTDGSSGQFLQTNGSAVLTWATATGSGGTGSTSGVGQGGQYEMAYYPGTGLSVIGSNTFTNNTVTGVVSITHATVATDSSTGAFKVTGGVGIGGSLYVGGIGASITGVTFSNSTITRGTWNGTNISTTYGGTGQNLGSSSGVLTISSGTVSASTTSSAIASALSDETGSGSLVFNSQPSFGTGVTTGDATFAVFNTNATTINAFGAATAISLGAATGKATFNSTDNSISSTTGGLVVSGGAGFAKSISVAGRLQLLNGANVTAFVSSGTGNTLYTLPATSPATGSSVLQSTAEGVMSWVPMVASSSGAGSGTVAVPNAQHAVAYYAGTGASVSGSNTFTNNTATGIVNITHSTVSTSSATGALVVSGGVGIGGSIFSSTSVPSSISGVVLNNGIVTIGTWSGNFITSLYGGTGFNSYTIGDILVASTGTSLAKLPAGATNFVLTSNGTGTVPSWQAVPASAASSVAVSSTVVDAVFYPTVINSVSGSGLGLSTVSTIQINPARGTFAAVGISAGTAITVVGTAAAINTTTGALQVIGGVGIGGSIYAGGISNFSSNTASISSGTGALVVTNGAAVGQTLSVGGSLNIFNGANYTGFRFSGSASTTYTLPTTSPAIGSSVLQSTAEGVMSWVPMVASSSSGAGSGTVSVPGAQYQIAAYYHSATGASVSGSTTFTNNTATGIVNITHSTVSTTSATGALVVSGGVGIGGSIFSSTSVPSSISGVVFNNGIVSLGTWSGNFITSLYGGTGFNSYTIGDILVASTGTSLAKLPAGATNFVLTSNGTGTVPSWQAVPAAAASSVAASSTVVDAVFYPTVINSVSGSGLGLSTVNTIQINPARGTFAAVGISAGIAITVVGTAAAINTTTGALQVIGGVGIGGSLYAGGISNFSSNTASISSGTGALVVTNGVGIGGSLNVASASSISGVILNTNYISATGGTFTTILQAATIRALSGNTISFQTIDGTNAAQINNVRVAVLYSTISTSSGTGALVVSGGAGIGGSLYVASASQFESSVASIGVGSGAVVVTGGVGIGGSLNVGAASRFSSSTVATSVGTGALTVTGGAGIAGSLYVGEASRFTSTTVSLGSGTGALTVTGGVGIGGSLYVANTSRFESSVISSSVGTGALTVTGGVGIGGSLFVGDSSRFTSSNIAISSGTGALTVTGGVGIGGSLYVANTSRFESSVISSSVGTGALVVAGGVGIGGSLFVGNSSRFSSTNISSSSGTGALTVTGGAGIGGSLYVGDASRFESNINSTTPGLGGLVATGGVGIGLSVSIGGRLQLFNSTLYTAFASAQSGVNTTYILPPTSPSSAGASFLTSTQAGVMAWVTAPAGGGGGSPSGSIGDIQYNSGTGNFAASSTLNYANATGMLKTINYNAGSASNYALLVGENNAVNFSGSATGTLLALSNTSSNGAQYNFIDAQFYNGSAPSNLTVFKVDYLGRSRVADLTITSASYATRTNNNTLTTSASQAADLTYTLPLAYPSGAGTSFLSASTTGVMAWVAAPSGGSSGAGSGTVAIPNAQHAVAYYAGTGGSVSGSATFTNNTSTGVVEITHTTESTSTTSGAFQVDGGAGIAKSLFVGTTLSVGTTPNYNIPNNLASFVSTVDSYNQLVIQNKSSGTSASANLVVNNNSSTDSATYGEIGMNSSTFTGSGALNAPNAVYVAAHTAPLVLGTVTSHPIRFTVNNGATDTIYIHEAGTAISVFTNFDLRAQNGVRFFNSGNTFYTALQAANNSANYTLSLPTAPVGAGYSTILVDTSGNMFFAPLEGGLAVTSATGNRVVLRNKMEHHVWMAAGYTPLAAGADNIIYLIPDSSEDGATKTTFELKEFTIRVETPSAGSSRIQLERSSTDTGAFTLAATGSSLIGGSGLTLSGAGIYVTTTNTFVAGTFVTSGNLLRLNFNLLNATHANFSVQFTLNEV